MIEIIFTQQMEHITLFLFIFYLLCLALLSTEAYNPGNGLNEDRQRGKVKLFVFGDSYADTGNLPISLSKSWKPPYGITFPRHPSGRFSDGRVLTDFIASFLGIKSPAPYHRITNFDTNNSTQHGINFAHGGTGVFKTLVDQPNLTTQIDFFQQLVDKSVYTIPDLKSSIAIVTVSGNDYSAYLARNGSLQDLPEFRISVIRELILNVRRINEIGIKKIGILGIEPLGFLPINTASASYKNLNAALNNFSESHNQWLTQNIFALNYEAAAPIFIYLDLYSAFFSGLQIDPQSPQGDLRAKLKPCCVGVNGGECGLVDKNGEKRYEVCDNPNNSFFWDLVHPSNAGWAAIYSALKRSLNYLLL